MQMVFLSVVGSNITGFPKPSDLDIKGCHIWDKEQFSWIHNPSQTINVPSKGARNDGIKTIYDYESHEIGKYISLLFKANVNYIEATLSPLKLFKGDYFEDLQFIARECISKKCFGHWRGFAKHTAYHAVQEDYKKPKRNLYLLRGYYQGIKLLEEDKFKIAMADFRDLDCYDQDLVDELYDCKINDVPFTAKQRFLTHTTELEKRIDKAADETTIREKPSELGLEYAKDLLYKIRYREEKL